MRPASSPEGTSSTAWYRRYWSRYSWWAQYKMERRARQRVDKVARASPPYSQSLYTKAGRVRARFASRASPSSATGPAVHRALVGRDRRGQMLTEVSLLSGCAQSSCHQYSQRLRLRLDSVAM